MYTHSENSDESQLVKEMLDFLKVDQSIQMPVDEGKDRDFLALYPSDLESPGTVLSPRYVKELALVKQAGADVLLTGNGGDEMCWGHSAAYTQRFKQGDWRVVTEVLKASSKIGMSKRKALATLFVKPFMPEIVLKMLTGRQSDPDDQSVPIWLTAKAKSLAIEETRIDNPFNKAKDPVGYNRYQSLKTTSTYNAVRSYQKVAQQFDIDVRHPFFNTKIAEFSFAIPPKQLIQGAYPKWLLRNSMDHKLPKSVCWNLKKTTFDQHFGNLVRENANELRAILQNQRLADMGLVNQSLLLAEFDRVVANPDIPLQVDLLYAILTFSWLKTHFPG
jgi:asparagine synthetase B (glutamine-hydrolysing)